MDNPYLSQNFMNVQSGDAKISSTTFQRTEIAQVAQIAIYGASEALRASGDGATSDAAKQLILKAIAALEKAL